MKRFAIAVTLAAISLGGKAMAHEFWISPESYRIAPADALVAQLRVGEEFRGAPQSYIPRRFTRFDVVIGENTRPVEARIGDMPALDMADLPEGLAVIVHETTAFDLSWSTWEAFARFADHKDLGDVAALHAERGLDQDDVEEDYFRYAKSLVAIGEGTGEDSFLGMRTELVALTNPYTDDLSAGLRVQLWLDEAPRPDAQIELFTRAPDGTVELTLHRTDADGVAALPVSTGHSYLVNAVAMEPMNPEDGAEWRTLWASLTFEVP